MKKIILISLAAIGFYSASQVCGCGSCSKANTPTEIISTEGIQFFQGTWDEAIQKSTSENKPIFLDVSTSWCGWCKVLKRKTFVDKEVGNYFNANFINVEIDAEQGEGKTLAQKYEVSSYPTLLVVDKNEKVLMYSSGYIEPEDLIQLGKTAINKTN